MSIVALSLEKEFIAVHCITFDWKREEGQTGKEYKEFIKKHLLFAAAKGGVLYYVQK
jgi:hypothetical protein